MTGVQTCALPISASMLSEDLLVKLSCRETEVQSLFNQYDMIFGIAEKAEEMSKISLAPMLGSVPVGRYSHISEINRKLESIGQIKFFQVPLTGITLSRENAINLISSKCCEISEIHLFDGSIEKVDASRYERVSNIHKKAGQLGDSSVFGQEVEPMDTNGMGSLGKVASSFKDYMIAVKSYKKLGEEEASLLKERDALMEELRGEGYKLVVCENCGTMMSVEVSEG